MLSQHSGAWLMLSHDMIPVNTPIDANMSQADLAAVSQKTQALQNSSHAGGRAGYVKAAHEFEGFMLGQMYKSMYNSVQKSELFGSGKQTEIFMGMYIDEASKMMSQGAQSSSLSAMLIKQYEQKFGAAQGQTVNDDDGQPTQENALWGRMMPFIQKLGEFKGRIKNMIENLSNRISSSYGERIHPISGREQFHHGVDIALADGTDVRSPLPGRVIFAGPNGGYGNFVAVDHGQGWVTQYAHLSEISVKNGDPVKISDLLGKVGSTGVSTGPHLHFEVVRDGKTVDPQRIAAVE